MIVLLAAGLSLYLFPLVPAFGYGNGEKTNTVDVYVGYFGTTYVYLQTVTEDEMRNYCECGEWTYSSIDYGNFTRYNLAYGATMVSLLGYCNIATSDVDEIYFLGTDDNYYSGFTNLFWGRYYFPRLAQNWNQEHPDQSNIAVITQDYVEVPAILAFDQSLNRDTGAFDYDKYKSAMSDENCLRIVFGQTVWNEVATADSVKWVYEMAVKLNGSPITASNWETQAGSSQALEDLYEVNSGNEALDELIKSGLQITSSDPTVVQVDANGQINAIGPGTARIYLEYSDPAGEGTFNAQIDVTVKENPDEGGGGDPGPDSGEEGFSPGDPDPKTGDQDPNTGDPDPDLDEEDFSPDDPNGPGVDDDTDSGSDESEGPDLTPDGSDDPDDTDPGDTKPDDSTPDGTEPGEGVGGDSGYGGEEDDGSNGDASGSGTEDESGTPGVGTEENQTPSGEDNGDEDTDSAAAGMTAEDPGAAERIREGMAAGEEKVPLSEEGEEAYRQITDYLREQLEGMDEVPDVDQIASLTEDVRRYIEELIEQAEEDDEPLDIEAIIEMVEEYIDEIVEEAEEADEEVVEQLSEEETSEDRDSRQGVYLSLGNLNGGDSSGGNVTTNGSMSSGNTAGGSGGKVLEIEPLPIYYTVIMILVLAALFVGGGLYRSLRFRRETAER